MPVSEYFVQFSTRFTMISIIVFVKVRTWDSIQVDEADRAGLGEILKGIGTGRGGRWW